MRRIAITLAIAIAVFAATMIFTSLYISRLSEETAEYKNNQILDHFCENIENNIQLTQKSVFNFMSSSLVGGNNDSTGCFTIQREDVVDFKAYVYDYLEGFMHLNKTYLSAAIVIDSCICHEFYGMKRTFAPAIIQDDTVRYDWYNQYNFMRSVHFAQLRDTRQAFWSVPTKQSIVAGKVMSLYVPINLDDGRFFGGFIVSIDVGFLKDHLKQNLPYGEEHSQMLLIDENDNIFAAYPPTLEQKGKKFYTYERNTKYVPWTIRTICEDEAVYAGAHEVSWIIIITSLTGMLLVFLCCYVIFRQISKNLREKATIEQELRMAADMQLSILKPATSKAENILIENFIRPAKEAGGDLYDYAYINGNMIAIIGDVSGKGMSAALFMAQVVSLFRNAVRYTQKPDEITAQINDSLSDNNTTMTFCTAIILNISSDGHVTYCNAGHTRPVWIHSQNNEAGKNTVGNAEFLNPYSNIVMGVMPGYKYLCNEFKCGSEDRLLFYTDGVTEAMNKSDKLYGEDRLLQAVNKSDDISAILKDIEAFTQDAPQSDDITITRIFL